MNKTALIIGLAVVFCVLPLFIISAQTEVVYPGIPGVISPQDFFSEAEREEDVFPLFMAYFFRLLLIVSLSVAFLVVIYGGTLYLVSTEDPEKKKNAKSWILGAIQGVIIVLMSYSLLSALDSRFLVFQSRDLEGTRKIEKVVLEWKIKDFYFQIPLGLLVEDAALNENARNKIYDILDAVDEAEVHMDAVVEGGFQLLEIIDECPVGTECDCDFPYIYPYPVPFYPHPPHQRPVSDIIPLVKPNIYLPQQGATTAQISIIQEALEEVGENVEKRRSENFGMELLKIVHKIELLLDKEITVAELREARSKVERFLENNKREIETLDAEEKEMLDNLLFSLPKAKTGFGGSTYYGQFEPPWGDMPYGLYTTFETAGCYGTSVAMVLDTLLEKIVTPIDVRSFSLPHIVNGSTYGIVPNAANQYPELASQRLFTMEEVLAKLDEGHMVIMGGSGTPHNLSRGGGHAFVLTGIDREKGIVYRSDPSQPYLHTTSIHEIKRNHPEIAHIIYRRDGTNYVKDYIASFLNKPKTSLFFGDNWGMISLMSSLSELFKTEDACASCCEECPEISSAIQIKIEEIKQHMMHLINSGRLPRIIDAKAPIEEDLYQLYKASMIKTLGVRNVIPYTTLLLNRRYHGREEISFDSYEERKELPSHYWGENFSWEPWYLWDWSQWIENITYKVKIKEEVMEENDPVTFYLKRPENNAVIKEAEELARRANFQEKMAIPPYLWHYLDRTMPPVKGRSSLKEEIKEDESFFHSLRNSIENTVQELSQGKASEIVFAASQEVPRDLTLEEFEDIFSPDPEKDVHFDPRDIETPASYLTCGMEIPVGETVKLIWDYHVELLDAADKYLEEGEVFLELQEIMNILAEPCNCPCTTCGGCDEEPPYCGQCALNCDKAAIYSAHEDVLASRERLKKIRDYIEFLTIGYFKVSTENVCHHLNEDVRSAQEKIICAGGGRKLITKHELITRKLNYSRAELDSCITRPEHVEDFLEGGRTGKVPLFGPLVEEKDIPRYTKTKKDGAVVITNNLNWFCCSDSRLEDD